MTNNHHLLYRLAEHMLAEQQNQLPVDRLFDDQQIGEFVKSIQIDSPYQQMLLEGVLTETVKEDKLYVTFTVEGYFHYVLGEVIFNQDMGKDPEFLKDIIENNKLNGAQGGVEQCLLRQVEHDNLSSLIWLVDHGGKCLDVSAFAVAHGMLINSVEMIISELLKETTDNDIEVLKRVINGLEALNEFKIIEFIYQEINRKICPDNLDKATLYLKSIKYIDQKSQKKKLDWLERIIRNEPKLDESDIYYLLLGKYFEENSTFDKALKYFNRALAIRNKKFGNVHNMTAGCHFSLGNTYIHKGEYNKAITYLRNSLEILLKIGEMNSFLANNYNSLGLVYSYKKEIDEAIRFYEMALDLDLILFGSHAPETATVYSNLGLAWRYNKNRDLAEYNIEKSLAIRLKLFGERHPSVGVCYNNLGGICKDNGDYDRAFIYYSKSLVIDLEALGEGNTSVGISYNNIANIFKEKKQFKEAIEYYQKAHFIFLKTLGEKHEHTKLLAKKINELIDL